MQENSQQDVTNTQNENNRQAQTKDAFQSENKNDGVQLSSPYEQYRFAKQHLRGTPRPEVFPFGEDGNPLTKKNGHQLSESSISGTLTATDAKMHLDGTYINQLNSPTHSNDRVYGTDGISPTLNTMQGGMRQPFVATGEIEFVGSLNPVTRKGTEHQAHLSRAHKQPARVHDSKGINPALSSGETQGRYHTLTPDMKIRRLTPVECERLQGFPDNWTASVSDTQRYKTCGNAVTVNVIADVMSKLLYAQNANTTE